MPRVSTGLALLSAGAALMVGMAFVALSLDRKPPPPPGQALSSASLYAARIPDSAGREQSLGQWQNRLLVINFWATWCAPCREEMPMLSAMQRKYGPNGMQIVGIAADPAATVRKFEESSPVGYPLLVLDTAAIDMSKRLGNRLGLLPFTVVVKPGGDVVLTRLGVLVEQDLHDLAAKFLQNAAS